MKARHHIAAAALLAGALVGVGLMGAAAAAVPVPVLKVGTLEALPTPLPLPYNEKATPAQVDKAIDAAFVRAKAENKRVIVDLGGNWCSWCRMLASVMSLPDSKPYMDAHFVVVPVHASTAQGKVSDRNAQVLKRFGVKSVDGYPYLIVADADGRVLARSSEVTDDNHHTPQTMLNWIAQYAKAGPALAKKAVS